MGISHGHVTVSFTCWCFIKMASWIELICVCVICVLCLPLNCPTLCFKNIRVSPKIRAFLCATCPKPELENLTMACPESTIAECGKQVSLLLTVLGSDGRNQVLSVVD